MSTLNLSVHDVYNVYEINSNTGYAIQSKNPILRNEKKKIQTILAAFRDLEFSQQDKEVRERKFHEYVCCQPQEDWAKEAEYIHYVGWKNRHEGNMQKLEAVKKEYGIISIQPLD